MTISEKSKIYYNVWCCAYQRRYNALCEGDMELYKREHETICMCLGIAQWTKFDTDQPRYLQ